MPYALQVHPQGVDVAESGVAAGELRERHVHSVAAPGGYKGGVGAPPHRRRCRAWGAWGSK